MYFMSSARSAGNGADLDSKHSLSMTDLSPVSLASLELDHVDLVFLDLLDDFRRDRCSIKIGHPDASRIFIRRVSDREDSL